MKAVLYARVSSKEQERDGYSTAAQRRLLHAFAQENDLTIIAEFCEAETAKQAGRRKFQEMIEYLQKHTDVKDALVEKADRHKTKKSGKHYVYYHCTNGKRNCSS